jgi:hypothetical protein
MATNTASIDDRMFDIAVEARKISICYAVFACHARVANRIAERIVEPKNDEPKKGDQNVQKSVAECSTV